MELIADLVRRRIPCCSQAARCSAGARFEHCRATSTTGRHPITDVGFCLPGCVRAVPVVVLLDAAGVPGAGGSGRPRDLATSLVRRRVSKPARASGPSGALHTGGACDTVSLMYPPWSCRHPPAPRPCPLVPPASSTPVALGVWLCRLASCPPRMRYIVRPAWLVVGHSGTKFALHTQNAPKRGISSEQGEFCTGSGTARLVQGEFCRRLRRRNQAPKHSAALWPGRSVHACPPGRRNLPRTRIGNCDTDRL